MSSDKSAEASARPSVSGTLKTASTSKSNLANKISASKSNLNKSLSKAALAGSRATLKATSLQGSKVAIQEEPVNARAIIYENTYRLKPEKKFPTLKAKEIAQTVLSKHLNQLKYDFETIPEVSKAIANEILAEAKKLESDRYKIIVDISIGEFKGQGVKVASRAIWDTTTDTYASASFKNATIFAVAMVFGCYYE